MTKEGLKMISLPEMEAWKCKMYVFDKRFEHAYMA